MRELETDPQPDGVRKFDYARPPLAMFRYHDERFVLTYQLQSTDPGRREWEVRVYYLDPA